MDAMQEIRGPKNKKQIGRIGKGDKIYIEDYAVTYLNQIARSPETKNGYAGLFGHCRVVDGKKEFYIYSAIYQECEKMKDGGLPREAVQKIMRKRGENFAEHFFLGWALIYRESAGAMWENCYRSRMETLMGKPELLMTLKCDTCEEHFYLYPTEMPKETEGYFIFYEQNDAMQNFLIGWHGELHKDKCDDEMDNVAENCRNYYKEKRSRQMRTRLAGVAFVAAALLLIFSAGVGIQNLNQYDKIKETGQAIEEMQEVKETADASEMMGANEMVDANEMTDTSELVPIEWEEKSDTVYAVTLEEEQIAIEENENVTEDVLAETQEELSAGSIETLPAVQEKEETEVAMTEEPAITVEKEELQPIEEMIIPEEVVYIGETEKTEIETEQVETGTSEELETVRFPEEYVTYEVAKGDTLYGICVRFYGNLHRAKEICELNNIEDMNNILYGQKILLPQ
ncbi:MAG: LysM peptidoglycan-binding domain-containing protein [Lachnospiraceae bacterium]|nr:LysM peptidoglycan-binding domain-containing protein [Lachnospiraceae bacterium]